MRQLRDIFKALSCETRLQMLALLLKEKELCVCDFVDILQITQSKASRHLRQLVQVGLLEDRRDAVWVHFKLAADAQGEQSEVLKFLPRLLRRNLSSEIEQSLAAWKKSKKASGGACSLQKSERKSA